MDFKQFQINNILKIASVADYIRCDMAFLLINDVFDGHWGNQARSWGFNRPSSEFWKDAIFTVKLKNPGIKFLAEVYSPWQANLQSLGFDYTYDKNLYDAFGNGNLDQLRSYISSKSLDFHAHSAHFVENHDEPRAASFFGGTNRADAAAMATLTLPGMRFFNKGQEDGYFNRLDVHLRRSKSESGSDSVRIFYNIFTSILAKHIAFQGTWNYQSVISSGDSWRLMAWKWKKNNEKILCVINYSDQNGSGRIKLDDAQSIKNNDTIPVVELISGLTYYRSAQDMRDNGLFVIIDNWSSQIFMYSSA